MSTTGHKTWPKLTSRDEFRFLADLVLKHSTGDHTLVSLHDQQSGTTRFANNQIVQNVDTRRGSLRVTVAFGRRHGTAGTTDFTAGAVQEAVARATQIAHLSPDDPEYLPPVEPQQYLTPPTTRAETAVAGPARRLEYTNEAIGQCRMENLGAAGIVSSSIATVGVAASTGLFAHEERTDARFSLTVQAGEATGWGAAAHRSIDHLRVQERTLTAIDKAKRGLEVRELPPGRYTVILEPAAVAGLWSSLLWTLDAKSYEKGTSAFSGKLGQPIVDKRLTLRNLPAHEDLLGIGFTTDGLPTVASDWIADGVLTQLSYDRFTAKGQGIDEDPHARRPLPLRKRIVFADATRINQEHGARHPRDELLVHPDGQSDRSHPDRYDERRHVSRREWSDRIGGEELSVSREPSASLQPNRGLHQSG